MDKKRRNVFLFTGILLYFMCLQCAQILTVQAGCNVHKDKIRTFYGGERGRVQSASIKKKRLTIKGRINSNNKYNKSHSYSGNNGFVLSGKTKYCYHNGNKRKYVSKSTFVKKYLKRFNGGKKNYRYIYLDVKKGKVSEVTISKIYLTMHFF